MSKTAKQKQAIFLSLVLPVLTSCGNCTINKETAFAQPPAKETSSKPVSSTDFTLIEGIPYTQLRTAFTELGLSIYYNYIKGNIIAISATGDYIEHYPKTNKIIFNDETIEFESNSIIVDDVTLIPASYIKKILELIENKKNNINYQLINELLKHQYETYFNPELLLRYLKYTENNPHILLERAIINVNIGLDYPFLTNINIINNPHDLLVLCNKYNKLPDGFAPYELIHMPDGYYDKSDYKDYYLVKEVNDTFIRMANDAKAEGLKMRAVSTYRTWDYQKGLFNKSVEKNGQAHADKYSARSGHSEHETGLAIDINSVKTIFENSKEFAWLQQNAHKYGFILRYPKGKEHITGYAYEPWHYRYVGIDVATEIYNKQITFEEYHAVYLANKDYIVINRPNQIEKTVNDITNNSNNDTKVLVK